MFDHKHYVPILRWKRAERVALRDLPYADKLLMTPLVEIPPVGFSDQCQLNFPPTTIIFPGFHSMLSAHG